MNKETHYSEDTPEAVKNIIENVMHTDRRVRLFYGDTERADFESVHGRSPIPGRDWGEENNVTGTIGRSTGEKPIPILMSNIRSSGGGAILTDCIIRMFVDGREVYRHPTYHSVFETATVRKSELPEYSHAVVLVDGSEEARFHSEKSAVNWLAFMQGKRMSK